MPPAAGSCYGSPRCGCRSKTRRRTSRATARESRQWALAGEVGASISVLTSCESARVASAVLLVHRPGAGWAKIERTIVATNDCALFGTRVSRLRIECVRHRCQAAPRNVASIASTSPGCASEVAS